MPLLAPTLEAGPFGYRYGVLHVKFASPVSKLSILNVNLAIFILWHPVLFTSTIRACGTDRHLLVHFVVVGNSVIPALTTCSDRSNAGSAPPNLVLVSPPTVRESS